MKNFGVEVLRLYKLVGSESVEIECLEWRGVFTML